MSSVPSNHEVLSRRAAIKQALRMGAYTAPAIVSLSFPTAASAATPPVPTADLSLALSVDNPTPFSSGMITLTVTLGNNGPSAATNVAVYTQLNRMASVVSTALSQGTYDSAYGQWVVGTLTNGASATLAIRLSFFTLFTGPMAFMATVTHSDQPDPSPANDSASVTITVIQQPSADLAITATVDNQTPQFGETITFMSVLSNYGPSTATNVTVHAPIPFGLTGGIATPSLGMYDMSTGDWTVSALAKGARTTLTIRGVVQPILPGMNYSAAITHSDQPDLNPRNDSAYVSVASQGLDLSIRKTVDTPNAIHGATVTFTVTLRNGGTIAGTGVTVTDTVPTELTFVSATPSQGSYDSSTGLWTVGIVAAKGTDPTLMIRMIVPNSGRLVVVNRATITHTDQLNASRTTTDFAIVYVP